MSDNLVNNNHMFFFCQLAVLWTGVLTHTQVVSCLEWTYLFIRVEFCVMSDTLVNYIHILSSFPTYAVYHRILSW